MSKLLPYLCLLPVAAMVAGCSSSDRERDEAIERDCPEIYIESIDPVRGSTTIAMPVSGLRFSIISHAVVPQGNFLGTAVYDAGEGPLRRLVLLVQVDTAAANQLFRLAGKARGKRLFLLVGGRPVGVHPIEDDMHGGNLFFDVEVPGDTPEAKRKATFALELKLNKVIKLIREKKADN